MSPDRDADYEPPSSPDEDHPLSLVVKVAVAMVLAQWLATLAGFDPVQLKPTATGLTDLGENRVMTFLRVTLPLAMPGVVAAVLIVFIPTIGDYVTPQLVGGPGGLMIANMIQTQFLGLNNQPMGATLAVCAMLIVTVIALLFVWITRRWTGVR